MTVTGRHDAALVALSIAIAVFAAYAALDLAARVRASAGWVRAAWLGTAAVAMGGGIWAMHFVAMLAFTMPGMAVAYDTGLTLLSAATAIVVTGAGFAIIAGGGGWPRLAGAGLLMGLGVASMHYMGMAAMRMGGRVAYDPRWVAASVLIAIGAATAALWLASRNRGMGERIAAALAMGAAIAGMHYAGMAGATFTMAGPAPGADAAGVSQIALATGVAAATFLILFLALVAAMFDRRFALLAEREAQALRTSEERFRSLYRGTPLPLHSLDREGRIEQVSDTWLALLGRTREAVVGRRLADFLDGDSARQLCTRDWPALLAGGAIEPREYRAVASGGALLDVVSTLRVERDEAGDFLRVLGGLTDVTERKRAEEALRQAQKIEAIGQLTGGVAHDFNNLLAVIVGNLDLLRRRLPADPALTRLAEGALEGARRGAALTQRLLAFARKQDLRPEAVDLSRLIAGMADLLQRALGPLVQIEIAFPPGLPPVMADAHQLELAVLNLAVNARDAMHGGGALRIVALSLPEGGHAQEGLAPGDYVRLCLSDEGEGMDAATLARATEPFFTTKGVGKGTGLGLSMVHGLAAQSGGRLSIVSQPGQGTTVSLDLPVARALAAHPPAAAPADAAPLRSRRALVVDDDPSVLANTAALLADLGHDVTTAASGEAALREVEADPAIDLVVTDQLMPGMTGTELARRLRALRPELSILIVSGYAEPDEAAASRLPMLAKPFDRDTLAAAIAGLAEPAPPVLSPPDPA